MFIRIKNHQNEFATGIIPVQNFSLKIRDDVNRMIIDVIIKEDSFSLFMKFSQFVSNNLTGFNIYTDSDFCYQKLTLIKVELSGNSVEREYQLNLQFSGTIQKRELYEICWQKEGF